MDHLGDFFRKKIEEETAENISWSKPDDEVRDEVLQQIFVVKPASTNKKRIVSILFFILFLLLLGGYIWCLKVENKQLKTALTQEKTALKKAHSTILNLKKSSNKQKEFTQQGEKILRNTNEFSEPNKFNEPIEYKTNEVKPLIQVVAPAIFKFKKENDILNNNISKQKVELITKNAKEKALKSISNTSIDQHKILTKIQMLDSISIEPIDKEIVILEMDEEDSINTTFKVENRRLEFKRFELGYEYGKLGFKSVIKTEYKDFKDGANKSVTKEVFSNSNGFYAAFFLKKPNYPSNLWLRTGIRNTNIVIEQDVMLSSIYDKTGEYIKTNGEIGNDLTLKSTGFYTETESTISISIPQGTVLETGDSIFSKMVNYQKFNLIQIPIGVAYQYGERNLKLRMEGGFQWNKASFSEYLVDGTVEGKNEELKIDKIEIISERTNKQFWGVYAGLGIDYSLSENWVLGVSLNYRYDWNIMKEIPNQDLINRDFRLRLGYKF